MANCNAVITEIRLSLTLKESMELKKMLSHSNDELKINDELRSIANALPKLETLEIYIAHCMNINNLARGEH